jgi:thymidylate kinase
LEAPGDNLFNMKKRGKLIVFYGLNNLGKTTQAHLLVERLKKEGYLAEYLKYAIYSLKPSGPILNNYLREGNQYQLTPREFQIIQVLNRTQYEPILKEKLEKGIQIVAEDYIGTGLAWGIGAGVDEKFLRELNSHLLKEDLAILFEGERFIKGVEKSHLHETNQELIEKVRLIHQRLAEEFNWKRIQANQSKEKVHQDIWKLVKEILE